MLNLLSANMTIDSSKHLYCAKLDEDVYHATVKTCSTMKIGNCTLESYLSCGSGRLLLYAIEPDGI